MDGEIILSQSLARIRLTALHGSNAWRGNDTVPDGFNAGHKYNPCKLVLYP